MIEWLLTILCKDYLFRLMQLIERTYRLEGRMDEAEHGLQEIRGRMAA